MEHLHSGARWSFRIGAYFSMIFLVVFFSIWFFSFIAILFGDFSGSFLVTLIVGIILVIIVGEIYARLAYNNWKYEFTKTELKIEKGIIFKTYKSIPYARIQNVDIHRGILARMLGFSTLDIQTAGYSGYGTRGGRGMSEGHIPAVSVAGAEKIREFVMKSIHHRGSGI